MTGWLPTGPLTPADDDGREKRPAVPPAWTSGGRPASIWAPRPCVEWLGRLRTPAVGRYVAAWMLYWPVPLQGVAYLVERGEIVILGI